MSDSNNLMGSNASPVMGSSSSMGAFKPANNISAKLPAGGSTMRGVAGLDARAENFSMKHSTKGLAASKPFTAKVRPIKNLAKSIGRKRGY